MQANRTLRPGWVCDRRCPRYRRMETKGDGRSGALVKLTPSPQGSFLFGARCVDVGISITMDSDSILCCCKATLCELRHIDVSPLAGSLCPCLPTRGDGGVPCKDTQSLSQSL